MDKIAAAAILKYASAALRSLSKEREALLTKMAEMTVKLATLEQKEQIQKVAEMLGTKGSYVGTPLQERIQFVTEKLASGTTLDDLERALDLMGPDGSLGSIGKMDKTATAAQLELTLRQIANT